MLLPLLLLTQLPLSLELLSGGVPGDDPTYQGAKNRSYKPIDSVTDIRHFTLPVWVKRDPSGPGRLLNRGQTIVLSAFVNSRLDVLTMARAQAIRHPSHPRCRLPHDPAIFGRRRGITACTSCTC